jgi:hypothetical protein
MKASKRNVFFFAACAIAACVLAGVAAADNPHGTPPGQAKQQQQAAANAQPQTSDNSTGVKPSSTTQHGTNAPAGSNKTKQYGNGQTAGQIAIKNGASSSTNLYGPGNSQPHKAAVCSKNGKTHYVDVHALKNKQAGACTAATTSGSASTQGSSSSSTSSSSSSQSQAQAGVQSSQSSTSSAASGSVAGTQTSTSHTSATGGVLGAQARLGKPVTRKARAAHAVLGTAHFTG